MERESRAFATDAKARLLHSLGQFDVGLLKMTVFNTHQQITLTPMGEVTAVHKTRQNKLCVCKQKLIIDPP
jgi:hypothetical protein